MTNMAIPIEELSHEEMGAFVVGRVYIHHYMYVYSVSKVLDRLLQELVCANGP